MKDDTQFGSRIYRRLSHVNTEHYSRLKNFNQLEEYNVCYTLYILKNSDSEEREILEQVSKHY